MARLTTNQAKLERNGQEFIKPNTQEKFKIIDYIDSRNVTIQFEDGTVVKNRTYQNIVKGEICNPYHKSVCGVGYFGVGKYNSKINYKAYKTWDSMIKRCYSEKEQEKCPTYIGCFVNERWHNFQNFAEWFCAQEHHDKGFVVDKDLKILPILIPKDKVQGYQFKLEVDE